VPVSESDLQHLGAAFEICVPGPNTVRDRRQLGRQENA